MMSKYFRSCKLYSQCHAAYLWYICKQIEEIYCRFNCLIVLFDGNICFENIFTWKTVVWTENVWIQLNISMWFRVNHVTFLRNASSFYSETAFNGHFWNLISLLFTYSIELIAYSIEYYSNNNFMFDYWMFIQKRTNHISLARVFTSQNNTKIEQSRKVINSKLTWVAPENVLVAMLPMFANSFWRFLHQMETIKIAQSIDTRTKASSRSATKTCNSKGCIPEEPQSDWIICAANKLNLSRKTKIGLTNAMWLEYEEFNVFINYEVIRSDKIAVLVATLAFILRWKCSNWFAATVTVWAC